jgi:thiol:disulfide interchange protein
MSIQVQQNRGFGIPVIELMSAKLAFIFAVCILFLSSIGSAAACLVPACPVQDGTPFSSPLSGFGTGPAVGDGDPLKITAGFKMKADSREGVLEVTAQIEEPWHIFSITQKEGGPVASSLDVKASDQFEVTGKFAANVDPHLVESEFFDVPSEEHEGTVKWSAPIKLADGIDASTVKVEIRYAGQRCLPMDQGGTCVPIDGIDIVAVNEGNIAAPAINAKHQVANAHALLVGKLKRVDGDGPIKPGESVVLEISAEPQGDHFVYALDDESAAGATRLALTKTNGWKVSPAKSLTDSELKKDEDYFIHREPATWSINIEIPADAEEENYKLGGVMGLQTCTDEGCDAPTGVTFEATVPIGKPIEGEFESVQFAEFAEPGPQAYNSVKEQSEKANADLGDQTSKKNEGEFAGYSLFAVLPLAFLAGFILNFMPCVLPVIGLKIMSFVHQAGKNPRKVFMLNFVFVLGMLAVFMILATLAVVFNLGWGQIYESTNFKVAMIGVIFVFGLSFFGIWEIPIPGLVGNGGLDQKDGYSGQFFKGVITTLLATPCSGPLLIPAVVWAIAQPPSVTYLVFFALGLGMALPYLVIGAFPKLAGFLPKPGPWMETFKQLMGFVMLATCIFLLGAIPYKFNMSVLCLLLFFAVGCWLIGRVPLTAPFGDRTKGWAAGLIVAALGVYFSFFVLLSSNELDYQKYSRESLDKHLASGKTVLVDFTADW